jgi:hypothetical protein
VCATVSAAGFVGEAAPAPVVALLPRAIITSTNKFID